MSTWRGSSASRRPWSGYRSTHCRRSAWWRRVCCWWERLWSPAAHVRSQRARSLGSSEDSTRACGWPRRRWRWCTLVEPMGRYWGSPARRPGWSQRYLERGRRVWGGCSPLGPRRLCTGTCRHRTPWTKAGYLCWPVACPSGACACQCWLPLWSAVYPGSAARSAFVCLCSFPAQQIRWSRGAVSTGSPGCRRQGTYLVWFLFSASRFRWYRCCTEPERSKTH